MGKAFGGQLESDGVVVPLIGVQHNAPGGKGPCFDHVHGVGKREGMTEVSRSDSPGGSWPAVAGDEPLVSSPVKVRGLQRALWAAAKQSEGRRFHGLFDRVCRGDVLREAWERVRENKGAAGVDRVTMVAVEDYGVDRWEQRRIVRYYLHRWPSQRAMARIRAKVRDRTGRNRVGIDIRDVMVDLNPILRGWGNYFRTGNAATKFRPIDRYVVGRLRGLVVKKRGRNLRAGQVDQWTEEWFNGHGLHRLRGTIRYPKAA
jgi:hypothetical protein